MPQELDDYFEWHELAVYSTPFEAEVDAAYLRSEGVPAIVIVIDNFPVPGRSRLLIDSSLEHRALWLLKIPPVSEAELGFLATGDFPRKDQVE
jgi:hypothetical protein